MTPQDLRIGNIVNRNGNPIVVKDIAKSGINMTIDTYGHCDQNYWTLWSEIEPIPLTEEWLLKFGFEKPKNRDCYIKKRLQGWKQMAYLIEEDTLIAHWIPCKLEHVHQLQNLYFALTGEELKTICHYGIVR